MFDRRPRRYFCTKKFYVRELGWTTWQGHFGAQHYQQPFRWKTLRQMDRLTAQYVFHLIHGLLFKDDSHENARHLENLKRYVSDLTVPTSQDDRTLPTGLKGGHKEKDLLRQLDLTAIKLNIMDVRNWNTISLIEDCGHHRFKTHCAMVASHAIWQ